VSAAALEAEGQVSVAVHAVVALVWTVLVTVVTAWAEVHAAEGRVLAPAPAPAPAPAVALVSVFAVEGEEEEEVVVVVCAAERQGLALASMLLRRRDRQLDC
jgi:hypothetical protein